MSATYIISKIDNNSYCKTNGQFARHIKQNNLTYKEYYELYVTKITPLCYCLKPLTFYQKTETYANSCGNPKCVGKFVSKTKQQWTEKEKHQDSANKKKAAESRTQEEKQMQVQKARDTFNKKYGVEWGSKSEKQKEKSRQTKLEKYGDEKYNNRKMISKTNLSKSNAEKNEINNKRRKTNLKKYGVENVLAIPSIRAKSMRSNSLGKDYTFPSGKVVKIRGYENIVLDYLFLTNYREDDIMVDSSKCIPTFKYKTVSRHSWRYYPDIYIPTENRIIEVKSQWWWDGYGKEKYKSRLENNLRKRQAVLDAGYNYEVWLFEDKHTYRVLKYDKDFQTE